MRLIRIGFVQFWNDPREWVLHPLSLQQINLIVGKNASGKSRTLSIVNGLANLISGRQTLLPNSSEFEATFINEEETWTYHLRIEKKAITRELLKKGSFVYLDRADEGVGTIFSEEMGKVTKFQSPQSSLAVFSRQDTVQHSFLQWLKSWADGTFFYPFGQDMGHRALVTQATGGPPINFYDSIQTTGVFLEGKKTFGQKYLDAVISDMRNVGYDISDINVSRPTSIEVTSPVSISFHCLFVQENGLKAPTEQFEISQGMFRALSILIHLNYGLFSGKSGCVIIDDIGEGLDFERSNALIKVVVEKVKTTNLQILMSSNDRFVMNSVPLEYWSILDRKGSMVHASNESNSKEKFESFRFTGLNNFDFFATDYLQSTEEHTGEKGRNFH